MNIWENTGQRDAGNTGSNPVKSIEVEMKFHIKNIKKYLDDSLRKKKYKGNSNPLAGHCYVVSEVLYHLYPGKYKPFFIRHEDCPHWFLKDIKTNRIVDLTASQFSKKINYKEAIGKGFLTKNPSKRAMIILNKIHSEIV